MSQLHVLNLTFNFYSNKDLDKNYHRVSAGWEHEYLLVCDMNSEFM